MSSIPGMKTARQTDSNRETPNRTVFWVGGVLLAAMGLWAYAPTIEEIIAAWNSNPDYSHGYFVLPLAALFLYLRRASRPTSVLTSGSWIGLLILCIVGLMRYASARFYLPEADAWSLVLWIAALVLTFGGWPLLAWSWPSIAFLLFAIPLPATLELLLSGPLRRLAAITGTWLLQCLAQPAIREGTTILLGDNILDVERACSGLRMLFGVLALAVAYIIVARPSRWVSALLLVAVLPVALAANAVRLAITGLLFEKVSTEAAEHFSHDIAGWLMIPVALGLLWLVTALYRYLHTILTSARPVNRRTLAIGAATVVFLVSVIMWHGYQQSRNVSTLLARAESFAAKSAWLNAAEYYDRYLRAVPDDVAVAEQLAWTFDKVAEDPDSKRRALRLFEAAGSLQPTAFDLHLRAASLALELGYFDQASAACDKAFHSNAISEEQRGEACLLKARAILAAGEAGDEEALAKSYAPAAQLLKEAIDKNPLILESYITLAKVELAVLEKSSDEASRVISADAVLGRMVENNSEDPIAWLQRYSFYRADQRYLARFANRISESEADLDKAIELCKTASPKNKVQVLLTAAERAASRGDIESATTFLQESITAAPSDYRPYVVLAQTMLKSSAENRLADAITTLKQGLEHNNNELSILLPLTACLIENEQLSEADGYLRRVDSLAEFVTPPGRPKVGLALAMLKAQLSASRNELSKAVAILQGAARNIYDTKQTDLRQLLSEVWARIGEYTYRLGAYDEAAVAFGRAVEGNPASDGYLLRAGLAAERAGQLDRARTYFSDASKLKPVEEAALGSARVELARQLMNRPDRRDWTGFLADLDAFEKLAGSTNATVLLRAEYLAAIGKPDAALNTIRDAGQTQPDSPAYFEILALAEQRWGTAVKAAEAAQQYKKLVGNELKAANLRSQLLKRAGKLDSAIATLTTALQSQSPSAAERLELEFRIAQWKLESGKRQEGSNDLRQLVDDNPKELWLLKEVGRIATEISDWIMLATVEEKLLLVEGDQGAYWRAFRAARLLGNRDTSSTALNDAKTTIKDLQALRPNWHVTYQLQGQVAKIEQRTQDAISAYQRAVSLGSTSVRLSEELIEILVAQGQFSDAEEVLDRVSGLVAESERLNSTAVPIYAQKGDFATALKIAQDWAEKHTNDSAGHLRLARMLVMTGRTDENVRAAEHAIRRAIELSPSDVGSWIALVSFRGTVQKDQKAALAALEEVKTHPKLTPIQRALCLSQVYEVLGDDGKASESYKTALQLAREERDPRLRLSIVGRAAQYFLTRSPALAERLLREIHDSGSASVKTDLVLSDLLARRGTPDDLKEAATILDSIKKKGDYPTDIERVQARIFAATGKIEIASPPSKSWSDCQQPTKRSLAVIEFSSHCYTSRADVFCQPMNSGERS